MLIHWCVCVRACVFVLFYYQKYIEPNVLVFEYFYCMIIFQISFQPGEQSQHQDESQDQDEPQDESKDKAMTSR